MDINYADGLSRSRLILYNHMKVIYYTVFSILELGVEAKEPAQ